MSDQLTELSFSRCQVFLNPPGIQLKDFIDDANPVEMSSIPVSSAGEYTVNGNLIRFPALNPIIMSFTLIPGSEDDKAMTSLALKYKNNMPAADGFITCGITLVGGRAIVLQKGTMLVGSFGYSADASGKMRGKTYEFAFQSIAM